MPNEELKEDAFLDKKNRSNILKVSLNESVLKDALKETAKKTNSLKK